MFWKKTKIEKITKNLKQVIIQGNNDEIEKLFKIIVKLHIEEFTEDNLCTIAGYLVKKLFRGFVPVNIKMRTALKDAMISELKEIYFKK